MSARPAAQRHLARRFDEIIDLLDEPEASEQLWRAALDELDTFEEIDLVGAAEAAEWRSRFSRARSLEPIHDEDVRARAEVYLEHQIGDLRHGTPGAHFEHFVDALFAFAELGILTVRERIAWSKRAAAWNPTRGEESEEDLAALAFRGSRIVRVLPGPDQRASGLRLTAIILFDDGLRFEWHLVGALAPGGYEEGVAAAWEDAPDATGKPLEIADDIGTSYIPAGDGWDWSESEPRAAFGNTTFVPAVPAHARKLTISVDGESVELAL